MFDSGLYRNTKITLIFSVKGASKDADLIELIRDNVDLADVRKGMVTHRLVICLNGGEHIPCIVIMEGEVGQVKILVRNT